MTENPALGSKEWHAVLESLGSIGHPSAVDPLLALLSKSSQPWRGQYLVALARFGDPRAMQAVLAGLSNPDGGVRRDAQDAIVNSRNVALWFGPLVEKLSDPDSATQISTAGALEGLTKRYFGTDPTRWRAWWRQRSSAPK